MSRYDKKPRSYSDYIKFRYLDKYLFEDVNRNFQKRGYLTPEEFFCIVIWKANRKKTKIRDTLRARKISIKQLTVKIRKAKNPTEKMLLLTNIEHIGVSMASAILAVLYPRDFTILDYRVWDSLKDKFIVEGRQPKSIKGYFEYLEICKELTKQYYFKSLRDFDRYSWGKSFYKDLIKLIESLK